MSSKVQATTILIKKSAKLNHSACGTHDSTALSKNLHISRPTSAMRAISVNWHTKNGILNTDKFPHPIKLYQLAKKGGSVPDGIIKEETNDVRNEPIASKLGVGIKLSMEAPAEDSKKTITNEYRELFAALFKIKDTKLTARIMNAINDVQLCSKCHDFLNGGDGVRNFCVKEDRKSKLPEISRSTQTSDIDFRYHKKITSNANLINPIGRPRRLRQPHAVCHNESGLPGKMSGNSPQIKAVSRLKPFTPTASRTSTSELGCEDLTPSLATQSLTAIKQEDSNRNAAQVESSISNPTDLIDELSFDEDQIIRDLLASYPDDCLSMTPHILPDFVQETVEQLELENYQANNGVASVVRKMEREFQIADVPNELTGMYPIQEAAFEGDINAIRRQIEVFKFRNFDINILSEPIEENGEQHTALHYAVLAKNPVAVVKVLLKNGANPLRQNSFGENVLHYIASQSSDLELFGLVLGHLFISPAMSKVDPIAALKDINDEGHSLLHILVKQPEKILHLKTLLSAIDEHLHVARIDRDIENIDELQLTHRLHVEQFDQVPLPFKLKLNTDKMVILNQPELGAGRTALYMAVQEQSIAQVLMLLSHYADPLIADRTGNDCAYIISESDQNSAINAWVINASCLHNNLRAHTIKNGIAKKAIKRKIDDRELENNRNIVVIKAIKRL